MTAIGGVSGMGSAMMPQVVSGASVRMSPATKMANLFQKIDTNNSGSITKAQFEQAFKTLNPPPDLKSLGADVVFNKLDPNGTGSVSKQDFINGMKPLMTHGHRSHNSSTSVFQNSGTQGADFAQTLANSINALKSLGSPSTSTASEAGGNIINTVA